MTFIDEEDESYRLDVHVTFLTYSIKKSGAFVLKFEIPTMEIASALQCASFIGINRSIDSSVKLEDEEGQDIPPIRVGVVKFDKMTINRGGDTVLALFGERLEDMTMDRRELRQLLERSMVLSLREA